MNAHRAINEFRKIASVLAPTNYAIQAIQLMSEHVGEIYATLPKAPQISDNADNSRQFCQRISQLANSKIQLFREQIEAGRFFIEIKALQSVLQNKLPTIGNELVGALEKLRQSWETYITQQTPKHALSLMILANELNTRIDACRSSLIAVAVTLEAGLPPYPNARPLFVSLETSADARQVIAKLSALQSIYSQLCRLVNISEDENPLWISDVEVSSIDIRMLGHGLVMSVLEGLLNRSFKHAFETFLKHTQRQSIGFKADELKKVLEIEKLLQEAGHDTSALKEGIEATTHEIGDDLARLVSSVPAVQINDTYIDIRSVAAAEYVADSRVLTIEGPAPLQIEQEPPKSSE